MADTLDLGSSAARCAGSSPVSGTNFFLSPNAQTPASLSYLVVAPLSFCGSLAELAFGERKKLNVVFRVRSGLLFGFYPLRFAIARVPGIFSYLLASHSFGNRRLHF